MTTTRRRWSVGLAAALATCLVAYAQSHKFVFDEALIPQFNIPLIAKPPVIDGSIGADEWRGAAKLMGMVRTGGKDFRDRPVSFWVAWDAKHLYIATRTDVLPGHRLYRQKRERYTAGTVFDDAIEFGVFLHDRNKLPGQVSSYLKFIINSLGSGEYMKLYPSIGQNLFNWRPEMDIANRVYERDGRRWWDLEIAADLEDLQMPRDHRAGDAVGLLLAADLKNPQWQWLDYPSASGHLQHYGFPRGVLTADRPYVQIEQISGLHDERLDLEAVVHNPATKPVKVRARARVLHGTVGPAGGRAAVGGNPVDPRKVVDADRTVTIGPRGSFRLSVHEALTGLDYPKPDRAKKIEAKFSTCDIQVTLPDDAKAPPVYTWNASFKKQEKDYLKAVPRTTIFEFGKDYNPVRGLLFLSADTLDAQIPKGAKAAGAAYAITRDGATIKKGRLEHYVHFKYEDLIQLPDLAAGKYTIALSLVDAAGKALASRDDISFEKKDEAKVFAKWWNNRIGHIDRVLEPFEPLKARGGLLRPSTLSCTRRVYHVDSLGLPRQIESNGGKVLTAPARIVVKVAGTEHVVPAKRTVKVTSRKDWRIEFKGRPSGAAGVRFTAEGWMEQDGLVEVRLTFAPAKEPVAIEELRIEWPIDDSLGNHIACIGLGGNYCARFIGRVPEGEGHVWSSLKDIGQVGSGMTTGSFFGNVWLGTEQRGLLWASDSDRGWVPDDRVAAHTLARKGATLTLRNHIIGKPFTLTEARTMRFGYNASPFRKLTPGWRINQVSAANGFSGGKYKVNWDTNQDYFSVLSPPFDDVSKWPAYYAHCKEEAETRSKRGLYDLSPRLTLYLTNQIALRGYMNKSLEPGVYGYFAGDWVPGGETLSKTYRDYMLWLQDKQVREGGCTHFYYDISFTGKLYRQLAAGFGYRLPDGRIQPEGCDDNLRRWYMRVWAMIHDNGCYPGAVSGHATNSISLKALPFADSILDSEYPMKDPISVYPSDRMIAMSCPHSYGVNISHLGFMNPNWPAMHDAVMGGGHGGVFWAPAFRRWGISRDDVEFIPYWRNGHAVKALTDGVLVSLWKRPGSAVMAAINYGPDPEGKETTRPVRMQLDLAALGIPAGLSGERLRIEQLYNPPAQQRYIGHLKWYQDLPGDPEGRSKPLPPIEPKLDPRTGVVDGFEVFYHDVRYLVIRWEDEPIDDAAWKALFPSELRGQVLDWGITGAQRLDDEAVARLVRPEPAADVQAWQRPGSVLVRLTCTSAGEKPMLVKLSLDLDALGVKVGKLWREFTSIVPLDGKPADNATEDPKPNDHRLRGDRALFNAWTATVWLTMKKGETRVFSIDRY